MLSRTADSLFWLGRYAERAGNTARGMQVAARMAGVAEGPAGEAAVWRSLLVASGSEAGFFAKHPHAVPELAAEWLVRDPDNPSSVVSCMAAARRNARAVRTAVTVDLWAALNDSWNELRRLPPDATGPDRLPGFLDWVRERVILINGAARDTMLHDEAWHFVQLGTMLERADNTARLLDVRHGALEMAAEGTVAYAQWQAILLSVSALRAYHWVYRDSLDSRRIAELMILRPEMPRSLLACLAALARALEAIAAGQGGRRGECHRLAGELEARLRYGRIEHILRGGLHPFLAEMIGQTADLGREIEAFYIRG